MDENFGLESKSLRPKLGRHLHFTPEGKVALMFLKMYRAELSETDMGGIEKSYVIMCQIISRLKQHRTRTKYLEVQKANLHIGSSECGAVGEKDRATDFVGIRLWEKT